MAFKPSSSQHSRLAQETRERFVADARRTMVEIAGAVQERLSVLMGEAGSSRDMQARRDAWTFYQRTRNIWQEGTTSGWQKALQPVSAFAKTDLQVMDIDGLQLVGTEVVENKIISSRLVLRVMDKVSAELDDLRLRIRFLENTEELDRADILRPEVLVLVLVEQWAAAGRPSGSWPLINAVVQALLAERLKQAYHRANENLIERGVMPTIDLKDRVRRSSSQGGGAPRAPGGTREQPLANDPQDADSGHSSGYGRQSFDNSGGARGGFQPASGARPSGGGGLHHPQPPAAHGGQTPMRPSWAQDPSIESGSQGLASRHAPGQPMPRRSHRRPTTRRCFGWGEAGPTWCRFPARAG